MSTRITRWLAMFCVLAIVSLAAMCQENTANVYGTVTDPSGAAIPGAKVSITSELTGRVMSTTSNGQGQFTFNFLPVGRYTIAVEQTGFQASKQTGISLVAGQRLGLTVQMKVASQTQSVTVSGEEPLIQTTSSDQLNTVNTTQVERLPLAKEDWTTLLTQQPGTTFKNTSGSGVGGLSMNGLPPAGFTFTIDGTNASNDPEAPTLGFYQSPNVINGANNDAISEVSVVKGIAPATVSGALSGNVNVVTKSGSNEFHGDAYEINDTSALDARNWFVPVATGKPRSTFNQFGGALGGPILKNRVFFFGSYQAVRSTARRVVIDDVPTPYLIANSPAIYSSIWKVFPSATQPASAPTATTVKYSRIAPFLQNDGNGLLRFDVYPTQANVLSVRYIRSRPQTTKPNIVAIDPRVTTGHSDELNASLIHTGGANWTSSTRFGYNRLRLSRNDLGLASDLEQVKFGFDSQGAEVFDILGATYTGEEGIAINRGRHALQFGGIVQRMNDGRIDLNTATVKYGSLSDFQNNLPNQIVITFDKPQFQLHTYQFGLYLQDDFRVTQALTLNLGLRWDYFSVPKESNNLIFNRGIDPNNPQLGYGFGPFRNPNQMYNPDHHNFAPRVGFAWGLGSDRKTVIRGGVGIFVSPHPIFGGPIEEVQNSPTQPFRITLNASQIATAGLQYPIQRTQYNAILSQLQASGAVGTQFANTAIDPNFPNPYSLQMMIGVERQLPWGLAGSVNYVGTRGHNLNLMYIENLPDRTTGVAPNPLFGSFRLYTAGEHTTYNSLQMSLQKRMSQAGLLFGVYYTHASNYSLASGNLLLENPPQDNNNVQADWGPTPYALRNQFSANFVYDIPILRWTGSNGGFAKQALGGWELSGAITADDGSPWNVTNGKSSYPSDRPNLGTGAFTIPNYRGTTSYSAGTVQFLNASAFAPVSIIKASGAQATPGNLGRDAVWGPGTFNMDTTLRKTFAITERVHLMMHGDFLDVLNHPNFSGLVTDISKGTFGQLTSATNRQIQIGAKIDF
jgi:hypothetical protein